jgi:hypothetical protein
VTELVVPHTVSESLEFYSALVAEQLAHVDPTSLAGEP